MSGLEILHHPLCSRSERTRDREQWTNFHAHRSGRHVHPRRRAPIGAEEVHSEHSGCTRRWSDGRRGRVAARHGAWRVVRGGDLAGRSDRRAATRAPCRSVREAASFPRRVKQSNDSMARCQSRRLVPAAAVEALRSAAGIGRRSHPTWYPGASDNLRALPERVGSQQFDIARTDLANGDEVPRDSTARRS